MFKNSQKGISLIETVIGISLLLVVFLGLVGFLQLGVRIVGVSKARVGATALANEQMEKIRNLHYNSVGTVGGIPAGDILQSEQVVLNNINYTRRVLVQYVDDPADGEGGADENGIMADYKRARVEVSWESKDTAEPVVLISDVMPSGIETTAGGGTLKLNVLDASIQPVISADIHIENNDVDPPVSIDVFSNSQGKVVFPGAPDVGNYEISITKTGYSSSQTYGVTVENPDPQPGHLTILEGETTEASFFIDLIASETVKTFESASQHNFVDLFDNESKIATSSNIVVSGGKVELSENPGYLISETIIPEILKQWETFSWNDEESASTTITFQVLFASTTSWELIPDEDLAGNVAGFSDSPVDLTILSISKYPEIRLQANLSTIDASTTPSLLDWKVEWQSDRIPLPFINFHMKGDKIIGYDDADPPNPIYKYSEDRMTEADGTLLIENLEWGTYLITIDGVSTGYDISESCPFQPVSIQPNTHNNETILVLVSHGDDTLLIRVEDETGMFIADASVRLYKTGYDKTQQTSDTCGQTFFTPLDALSYTLEVTRTGYQNFSLSNIEVSGQTTLKVILSGL